MWCFAFNNFSCYCFYCNETFTKCDVLLLTITLVTFSIAMKLLENVMFLLLTIPVVSVSIAMKLLENVMFLLIAIPFVSVSIAMKLLQDFMFCF